ITYLTDVLPPRRRGMLIFVTVALAFLGAPVGVFLIRWLTPLQHLGLEAWRWAFLFGGVGAATVGILFRALPESPRWLHGQERHADAQIACEAFERSSILLRALPADLPARAAAADASTESPSTAAKSVRRWTL